MNQNPNPTFVKTIYCEKTRKLTLEPTDPGNFQRVSQLGSIHNSQVNKGLFKVVDSSLRKSNLPTGEWKSMVLLAEERII